MDAVITRMLDLGFTKTFNKFSAFVKLGKPNCKLSKLSDEKLLSKFLGCPICVFMEEILVLLNEICTHTLLTSTLTDHEQQPYRYMQQYLILKDVKVFSLDVTDYKSCKITKADDGDIRIPEIKILNKEVEAEMLKIVKTLKTKLLDSEEKDWSTHFDDAMHETLKLIDASIKPDEVLFKYYAYKNGEMIDSHAHYLLYKHPHGKQPKRKNENTIFRIFPYYWMKRNQFSNPFSPDFILKKFQIHY